MNVKGLLDYWASAYYTTPFAYLISIIGIAIMLLKRDIKQLTDIFIHYLIGYLVLGVTFSTSVLLPKHSDLMLSLIVRFVEYSFTIFEFLIFSFFFIKVLQSTTHKMILRIIRTLFLFLVTAALAYDFFSFGTIRWRTIFFQYTLQAFSLLVPCTFYYTEIFKYSPRPNLLNEPSFWVVTGLSFMLLSTLPFSLFCNYWFKMDLSLSRALSSLFYIFYALHFLMIIKGHLCKQKIN